MLVDQEYLAHIEVVAKFQSWASMHCSDAKHMNVGSDMQLRQLFFGGISNSYASSNVSSELHYFSLNSVKLNSSLAETVISWSFTCIISLYYKEDQVHDTLLSKFVEN